MEFKFLKRPIVTDNLKKYVQEKVESFKNGNNSISTLWFVLNEEEKIIANCIDADLNWIKNKGVFNKPQNKWGGMREYESNFFGSLDKIDAFSVVGQLILFRLRPRIFTNECIAFALSRLYSYFEFYDLCKILLDFAAELREKEKEKVKKDE